MPKTANTNFSLKVWAPFILAILCVLIGFFYWRAFFTIIPPGKQGIRINLGTPSEKVLGPGDYFHLPLPLQSIVVFGGEQGQGCHAGTNKHPLRVLTLHEELVDLAVDLEYRLPDHQKWTHLTQNPDELVCQSFKSAVIRSSAKAQSGHIISHGFSYLGDVKKTVLTSMQKRGIDLTITNIEARYAAYPKELDSAMALMSLARQDSTRALQGAQITANNHMQLARTKANIEIARAHAYAESLVTSTRGDSLFFADLMKQSNTEREISRQQLYHEVMQEILPKMKKVVVDSKAPSTSFFPGRVP